MRALRWANLAVFPLILGLSILPLLWFGRNWAVPPDGSSYLLIGWNLISGGGYTSFGEGGAYTEYEQATIIRGPVFPGLLGGLMLLFGRDVESLAWAVRLLALANPVLMYFLIKRIAGPMSGLLAAAMVALFSITATWWHAFNIDAVQLTVYLLAVLVLLVAAQRDSTGLSLLSGLLLGAAIITKETSFVALPLAFFAALVLGWSLRGVLLHYVGVVMACLPWWIWVWVVSGQVYLLGRLPSGLTILVVVALALIALFVIGSYRSGVAARLLANERRRRQIGWLLLLTLVAVLSGLLLSTSSKFPSYGEETMLGYVWRLRYDIRLWYLLPFAGLYVLWETVRGNRLWEFYLALLVLQIPISLLVVMERLETRMWLIPQTLLYGALAGMMAKVLETSIWKERHNVHRALAFGATAALLIVLAGATVSQARYLQFNDVNVEDANGNNVNISNYHVNDDNSAVHDMYSWIAENVPEREEIITTPHYASQLAFLDGMQHKWTVLHTDCALGPSVWGSTSCQPSKEIAQTPPQPTVWFKMDKDCNGLALSIATLMRQIERSGSAYLLTTQESTSFYPANLAWAPYLYDSGAFEVVHYSYLPGAPTRKESYGLVLLKTTGQNPAPAPVQMDVDTVQHLVRCGYTAWGERYAERIRSTFPNGIEIMGGSRPDAGSYQRAIESIEQIYRTH